MYRALLSFAMFACLVSVGAANSRLPDFRLRVIPAIVYKVDDPGNTGTSSFVFDIAVICSGDCTLTPNLSTSVGPKSFSRPAAAVQVSKHRWSAFQRKILHFRVDKYEATRNFQPSAFSLNFYVYKM